MENELRFEKDPTRIDTNELLIRFILSCQDKARSLKVKDTYTYSADLVTAVYYFRKFSNVESFIEKYLKNNQDYFKIQWVRATWNALSKLTDIEISELIINQIIFVANSEEAH